MERLAATCQVDKESSCTVCMHKFSPGGAREQLSGAWRLTTPATQNEEEGEKAAAKRVWKPISSQIAVRSSASAPSILLHQQLTCKERERRGERKKEADGWSSIKPPAGA
ncbi:unnamed protein product [Tetraodon nigroviridis]|uniref:(spotted green pufferfish) hypothetical protein n=1 Tax=Tetraodon nigroviridis TaxID=99883 RepID=Q4RMU7_TETNG|nr:unnamed protein product [Tetraodon nigroviridis]